MSKVRLFPGDCREIMRSSAIQDASYDAVITDMPYYNQYGPEIKLSGRKALGGEIDFDVFDNMNEWLEFTNDWIELCIRKLRKGGTFLSFTNLENASRVVDIIEARGLQLRGRLYWHKVNPAINPRKNNYLSAVEPALWAIKPGGKVYFDFTTQDAMHSWRSGFPWCNDDDLTDIIDIVIEGGITQGLERTKHPTQKPIYLMRDILLRHVPPGGKILEPFGGSGSTAVAAMSLGMDVDICEQEEQFLAIIKHRLSRPIQTEFVEPK